MKVFDPENIFTEEAIKESENLVNELKKITGPTDRFDDEIFLAHEKVRKAEVVQADPIMLAEARSELDKALRKKREFKVQIENQRNGIFRGLEEISKPVIQYLSECADEGISRVWRLRIFQHSGLKSDLLSDKITTEVETNLSKVYEVRELLLNFKSKIHSMAHSPLKKIQILSEEVSEKVNFIALGKAEAVSMSLNEALAIESDLKERISIPIPPEVIRLAQTGWLEETYDNVKLKVKRVMGG
jgi:hypothetical protein